MSENVTSHKQCLLPQIDLVAKVKYWLKEDTPSFDYGGYVVGDKQERAVLLCKSPGVLSGVPFFNTVFSELNCTVSWVYEEGTSLEPICNVAYIHGKAKDLLLGERVALNILTRSSGISTQCRNLSKIKLRKNWHGEVAGTRKTTPGFRIVEKYALLVGGLSTHRYDLSSMIMLKDNHIWSVGNVKSAVKKAREVCGFSTKIEVECRSVEEAKCAAAAGAEIVMLDNFAPCALHDAAREVKESFPYLIIEASGGITENNIEDFMGPNVDVISMGCLTQGYPVVDFSMKIMKEDKNPENPTVTNGVNSH
ncbi:nicotinate-nucleotide pyrophosphorylase [carboxylating]-like [Rhopilema esculentum]|uniref:nicotinate-nucleotide pyrophosphorylase [carboxylating]-like n=1 Tax=Rhopilema esculentum TaxID=499914 RepID=UPI0031D874D5|eukprot:gene14394-5445_t